MKFSKTHEKQMREYMDMMDAKGCVPVTDWVSGSGRFTSLKALPPFVQRFKRIEYADTAKPQHGTPERAAYDFFRAHHRRKAVLVMDTETAMRFLFDAAHGNEF